MSGGLLAFALAVPLNYAWELAQTPFYAGVEFPGAFGHCFVAALGDGLIVLGIHAALVAGTHSPNWYAHLTTPRVAAVLGLGLVIALVGEWWGVRLAEGGQYSNVMPIIPGTRIGLIPVVQMLLVPPAVFGLVGQGTR